MQAVRTIVKPPLSNTMTVRVPDEYRSYSLEVIVMPIMENDFDVHVACNPWTRQLRTGARQIGFQHYARGGAAAGITFYVMEEARGGAIM